METSIKFVVHSKADQDVMKAAGVDIEAGNLPATCPLQVGDTVRFPGESTLCFRVMHRHLEIQTDGTARWKVAIRASPNPLLDPATFALPA